MLWLGNNIGNVCFCSRLSNFIHQRVTEKNEQKILYNKLQNTIDMQHYQAYVPYKVNCKALRLQKQQMLQRRHGKLV